MKNISCFTITLISVISLPVCSAKAATISFTAPTYSKPIENFSSWTESANTFSPNVLKARANSYDSDNIDIFTTSRSEIKIRQNSTFTVNPSGNEKIGQKVKGVLKVGLFGLLTGRKPTYQNLNNTGSYYASVAARVDAEFASWSSPAYIIDSTKTSKFITSLSVNDEISVPGLLQVGKTYNFDMVLFVNSSARNYLDVENASAVSDADFYSNSGRNNRRFYATVETVPEPITIGGTVMAGSIGWLLKRKFKVFQQSKA
ncbi:MAG: PEP-CTERM sorting domain-containing protein [Komarekiella atlantica HA4396-MV6]|jgi:hypothetical protein|nr:PEP-CTERM sorting domain-containing protein [Komarekiella atlantica HA4396-MV6]